MEKNIKNTSELLIYSQELRPIDLSGGDSFHQFTAAANYALSTCKKSKINQYQFSNPWSSTEGISDALRTTSRYFSDLGFIPQSNNDKEPSNILITAGTTEGYNLILRMLLDNFNDQNTLNRKPAILMPFPTYGFFADNAERLGLTVIPIIRDIQNDWHLNIDHLRNTLQKFAKDESYHIIAYYDCNPSNPLGLVRDRAETYEIARTLQYINEAYRKRNSLPESQVKNICIIDDMIYLGLEYNSTSFSFSQIPDLFEDTLTLVGTSKSGLASLRGGAVIGGKRYVEDLSLKSMKSQSFLSKPAIHAIEYLFNNNPKMTRTRDRYYKKLNDQHSISGLLFKSLINGIGTMEELTKKEKLKLTHIIMHYRNCSDNMANDILQRGIKGLKVITTPKAGFFHLIDFSSLKNLYFHHSLSLENEPQSTRIDFSNQLYELICDVFKIRMARSEWSRLGSESFIYRVSFAIPYEDIFETIDRLDHLMNQLSSLSEN